MARRATSLGPKPSLFVIIFVFLFWVLFFLEGLRVRSGGPKGALNPPYVFVFSFRGGGGLSFLCLHLIEKLFPHKKGMFVYFSVSPLFLLSLFSSSFFHFLFLCLSLVLFLPSLFSFLFALFCFLGFLLLFLSLVSLLLLHEKNNIKIWNLKVFLSSILAISFFFFWGGGGGSFSFKSLFLNFVFFLLLSFVFVQH